ncbi:hypothetical protein KP509_39G042400 [Ceratopteris richardii]|uniref:Rad21/Rec8-like protein C-terminal eukaryotic domain-containing protein n=1 Tax=Ceratopteris richardii TaxID=49495 RepID=A0A8T2Q0I6_CERRI|nr:hypothetical protein KP509_39G042400 [Ceratopteris richardii]
MSPSATSFPQDKIVPVSSVQESAAVMTKPLSDSFTCLEQRKFDSFQGSTFFTTDGQMVLQQSRAHFFQNADEVSTQSSGSLFQFREPTQYLENIWTPPLRENSVAASETLPSQTRVDVIQDADKISKRPFGSFLQSADSIHQPENIQASTFKENTAPSPVSLPHHSLGTSLQESNNRTLPESVNPSTSQGICLQQIRSSLSQEGTTIPTNALCSSLTSSTAFPLPQLEKVQAQYIKENAATTSTGFPILFQQTLLQQNSTHPLHASAPTVLQQSKLQQNSIGSSQTSAPTISQQSNLLLSQEGPNIPGKALDYSLASSSGKQNAPTTSMASPNSLHQARVQQNSTVSMQTSDATILQRNNLLLSQEGSLSRSSTTSLPEVQSIQTSSIEENTVMATKDIPNFIQQTYSQQNVTGSLQASANFPSPQQSIFLQKVTHLAQESADFTTNTSGSLTSSTKGPLTLLAASMPQHMDAHVTTISSDFCNIPQQACLQQNKTTPLQDNVDISAPQHLSFKKARIILPQDGDTSLTNTSGAMGASSVALMSQLNDAYVSPAMENRPPCPPQVCLQQSRTCLSEDTGRPLQASLHQSRMVLSHEGNDYSIDQSSSLCAPAASMPETGMNLYPFPKNQWGNNTNQVVSRPFPQQILADDQSTPKTAFQMSTESSGFGLANYHHQSVTGRGLMPSLPSQTVVTSSFSTNSASSLIIGNVHQSGQMEHMNLDKSSAGTKGLHWQSVSQQLNPSLSTTMAPLMPSMCMEECETLRSSHHLQSRPSDFTLLQTNTSVNRTTASEVGRNRFYSPNFEEASKESLLSGSDKTPMWRDVSPSMSMRTSSMSTPNLDSRPRDDDVLGSILGPRDNIFKVISTPEAQKTSKADVATKKPKLISRATAKRRKVDLDVMAVLHGDVIRQQLANTEDIRRERRKAPCTRREVWSFLREHEGQDNCSEPTLPELSADIHELYHDVIHGRESKPHPLNGAAEVRGVSKARTGEESDLLAHYVMKISSKEMLSSEGVNRNGSHSLENQVVENASSVLLVDNSQPVSANNVQNIAGVYFSEQLKEIPREDLSAQQSLSMGMLEANNMAQRTPLVDTSVKYSDELKGVPDKAMSVQENICDGLIEADNVEVFRSDELAISHAAIEVQAEKEGPTICFPDAHFTEATSTVAISGTRDIEHDAQAIHVEREIVNAEKLRLPELVEPELGVESLTKAEGQAITSPLIQVPQCTVTSSMGEARIEDQAVQITQSEKEHEMLEQVPEVTLTFGTNEIRSEEQGAQTIQLEEKHEVIENVSEDTFSLDMNETRNKEQDVQATHLEREQEVLEQVKMMSMIDNHSEIVHKEELNQDVIIMHRDRERENQHVSDIHEHACHEGQLLLPSEAASLQSSAMPSAGKDSIDVPAIEDAKLDHGNTATNDVTALAEEKLSASFGVEEDVNIDRFDGEIVAMEIERGTDFDGADPDAYFAEEDNKLPYAEIDYSSDEQELSVKDDSGWSTRTRNVGKYLKTLFQEMGSSSKHMDEAPNLGLERLLSRRTRKEAARMFFETLVLKTKDYVHVVQDVPYHDVLIYPKSKLMKTEF